MILGLHGLLIVALNVTNLRKKVKENLDEDLMGWLLRISQTSYWFDALVFLMAESFFELLLCSVLGFFSVKNLSAITMTTFDYISSAANIAFLFLIASFVVYTVIMTCYTLYQQKKNVPRWTRPSEIDATSFLPQ